MGKVKFAVTERELLPVVRLAAEHVGRDNAIKEAPPWLERLTLELEDSWLMGNLDRSCELRQIVFRERPGDERNWRWQEDALLLLKRTGFFERRQFHTVSLEETTAPADMPEREGDSALPRESRRVRALALFLKWNPII